MAETFVSAIFYWIKQYLIRFSEIVIFKAYLLLVVDRISLFVDQINVYTLILSFLRLFCLTSQT